MQTNNNHLDSVTNSQIMASPLRSLLGELRQILDNEETELASGRTDSLEIFAREKLRVLVSLNRITNDNTPAAIPEEAQMELQETRQRLDENMQTLKFRMSAIGEIANTIETAIKDADSDGTYEAGSFRNGAS